MSKKIAVIGAGPMGLICAYRLLQQGHDVSIFERDDRLGGMSASFDFEGLKLERFYHFICKQDSTLLEILHELGLEDRLQWRKTRMGFFYEGTLYKWGNPLFLLLFNQISLLSRLRYALHIFACKHTRGWDRLDKENAVIWLKRWLGDKGYRLFWRSLLTYKYYDYRHQLSAAWIASRIQRIARSRDSLFTERLGYLTGGSQCLIDALETHIRRLGGKIHTSCAIESVTQDGPQLILQHQQRERFDHAISTIPLPFVPAMVPGLTPAIREKIANITNVGVVCVVLKLRHALSANFWTNINDSAMQIPGIIEYSNLCPMPDTIVYVPYYLPHHHLKYRMDDAGFIDETLACLKRFNEQFDASWIKASKVTRYGYAQPVCTPHFFSSLPPMQTNLPGLLMADTSYYYPEDRSISESLRIGIQLAGMIHAAD